MPRKPRFFLPAVTTHVVQRGNNRQAIFFSDSDCRLYLGWLREAAHRWHCAIHAYVLMTNHVHLLLTPEDAEGVSRIMQYLGRRYVPYVNQRYGRSGTLWEGRFRSSLVQSETYLLACHRYIELNPVRAGMVNGPGDYPWSSYLNHALGEPDPILTPHVEYLALGPSDETRQAAYRALFERQLDPAMLKQTRACLQTGTPLGNDRFREQIELVLGRSVGFARRGRPRRRNEDDGARDRPLAGQLPIRGL
jgi:REP-associated tyrosine transposase